MSVEVEEEEIVETAAEVATLALAVIKIKDEKGKTWKEAAEVISVSQTGAGFYLKRECKPGRLVLMMLPVDPELRFYDHNKELYRVWGLVQHCHRLTDDDIGFHVGVAFIGKETPDSYETDPLQSYRIVGMTEQGLWKVSEAAREFKPRQDTRFYTAIDHYLAVVDAKNVSSRGERTITENISKHGAAVMTSLDLHTGDRVKFISEAYDFSGVAVVCNRKDCSDGQKRLHLQFVGSVFPVERVNLADHAEVEVQIPA